MQKPWDLAGRTMQFAVSMFRFCRLMPSSREADDVTGQLRRASTAVAANYRATRRGRSDREFISKMGVVIEEADESLFWLEFLVRVEIAAPDIAGPVRTEANELVAIFTASQKTVKAKRDAKKKLKRRQLDP
jgi:four helix bundle protein